MLNLLVLPVQSVSQVNEIRIDQDVHLTQLYTPEVIPQSPYPTRCQSGGSPVFGDKEHAVILNKEDLYDWLYPSCDAESSLPPSQETMDAR